MGEPGGSHARLNKPVTNTEMLSDSAHGRHVEQPNSHRQKIGWWLLRAGGRGGGYCLFYWARSFSFAR